MSDLVKRLRKRVRMLATPAGGDIVVKLFPEEVIEIADEIERLRTALERYADPEFWPEQLRHHDYLRNPAIEALKDD